MLGRIDARALYGNYLTIEEKNKKTSKFDPNISRPMMRCLFNGQLLYMT